MDKNYGIKILIIHKNCKKWGYGQGGRNKIAQKRYFLQLMGIKPDAKNIGRKEYNSLKRNITGKKNRKKIQNKIGGEFGPLTYQTVQHTLSGLVDQVLFRIVKIINDIASGYDQG
jgi:hypothetical protein